MIDVYLSRPFHDVDIHIKTDNHELSEQIRDYYKPFIVITPKKRITSIVVILKEDHFLIRTEKHQYQTENPLQEVINFIYENTSLSDDVFALHAAAIEYNKQAYVLIGSTGTGKTTLTTYLSNMGFGYITDDCALIERSTLFVHPYPCDIHLRSGGIEVLRKRNISLSVRHFVYPTAERYLFSPENTVKEALPLNSLLWLERTENQNDIQPMLLGERIQLLMKSVIAQNKISGEYIKFLSKLSTANCKKVCYKDMAYVEQIIRGCL